MAEAAQDHEPQAADPEVLGHDLANLVQALCGNLELLAGRELDKQGARYLANARLAAQQLAELTRKLREDG